MTQHDLSWYDLGRFEQRPALVMGEQRWSYAELAARTHRWATAYREFGLQPAERVAIYTPPVLELVPALLGAIVAGLVAVPVNPRYPAAELRHVLTDSGAAMLLTAPELARRVDVALPHPVHTLRPDPDGSLPDFSSRAEATEPEDLPPPLQGATALLIYTSGTTGRSKGVMLSNRAIDAGIGALTRSWRWSSTDVLSLALPLFHVHGLGIGIFGALMHGVTIVLHPKFDPESIVRDFGEHGATIFMGVPTMYARLLEYLEANPGSSSALRSARLFTSGSAALPARDFERFEKLTGHRILERYGMTETLLTLSNPYEGPRKPGFVGRPIAGVDIRLVDDDGVDGSHTDSDHGPAELWVRAEGIMSGYWGRPEDTNLAFGRAQEAELPVDGDWRRAWFRTGDVVRRDADGFIEVVGRKSVDIIKSGGFKIGAREIEDILVTDSDVEEVAVFGVPDATWGERIVAAVVLRSAVELEREALLERLQSLSDEHLADYKKPRDVMVLDALPRNALGKVQKTALKQQFTNP